MKLKKTVVFVGMMGAGKTAVGRTLAQQLRVPFVDSDDEIEAAAAATISEIFAKHGENFFREKEARVIARLLEAPPHILATGGGAFLQEINRTEIAARAVSVYLDADLTTLWSRVAHKTTRPLLRTADPRATLERLWNARAPTYARADITVRSAGGQSLAQTAAEVTHALLSRPDVLSEEEA
ncbi:MAG: shikimate kinase [Pseudomonadota bacterium]